MQKSKLSLFYTDRRWRFLFLLVVTFFWHLFFLVAITPLIQYDDADSAVYKQMGLTLLQGNLLYADLFDHKGPFLYFINAVGILLGNGRWGLFLLHVFNYAVVAYLWTETIKPFVSGWKGLFPVLLGVALYICLRAVGNSSEDWCLIPISYATYLGVKALTHPQGKSISVWSLLALGISAGVVLFIRANNAAAILCTFLLLVIVERERWAYTLFYVSLGFVLTILLVLSFFYLKGGYDYLSNMIFGTFLFNLHYAALRHSESSIYEHPYFFYYVLMALCLTWIALVKNKCSIKNLCYVSACYLITIATMGHNSYAHYLIVAIPIFVVWASMAIADRKWIWVAFICGVAIVFKFPIGIVHFIYANREGYAKFYQEADAVISRIPQSQRSKIWNYNTINIAPSILQRNNIVQCNRIFHLFQFSFSDELRNECADEMVIKSPEWIITTESSGVSSNDSLYIAENYVVDAEIESIYLNTKVLFYKRKHGESI